VSASGNLAAGAAATSRPYHYRTLERLGVSARNASLSGRIVRVRLTNKRRVEIRLAVIRNRQRELQAWSATTLNPGSRTLVRKLNKTPTGPNLNLRVTARIGKVRARGIISLRIVAPTTPPPPPSNRPPGDIGLSGTAVAENQPAGTTVGTLTATDPNPTSTFTFALVSGTGGTDNASFAIAGNVLRTAAALDAEATPSLSVRVKVTNNRGGTFEKAFAITVADANDAPVVTTSAGAAANTEGATTTVDGALTVTDQDDTNLGGAVVRVSSGFQAGDDLIFVNTAAITGSYDNATGVLTLTGSAPKADYETALRSIAYRHTGDDPSASKTIEFAVNDGSADSAAATKAITVTPVNDAPIVGTMAGALAYTENAGAVAVDSALTVADPDNAQLTGATVAISANLASAQDALAFTNQLGITGSYNAGTGVLTLTGTASVASYQTALRSITYANSSDTPSTAQRTVSFSVSDGALTSNVATRNIAITAVDDGPVVTTSVGTTAYAENGSAVVVDATVTPSDADDTSLESAQVRISAGFDSGDLLLFTNQAGITGSYNSATGVMTLTGTSSVANYLIALRSIGFSSSNDNPALSKTVEFKVNDGDVDSNVATKAIAVTRVNDAPTVDTTNAALAYAEGAGPVAADAGVTVTDPDSTQIQGATVQITSNFVSAQDELAFASQLGISGSYDDTTGTLTLTGTTTVADYEAALRAVTYENSSDDPAPSTRTLTFVATDATGAASAPATRDITLGAANDSATVTTSGGSLAYTEGDPATAIDGGLTVSDPDDVNLTGATVQITGGLQSDDELLFTSAFGVTNGGYVPATGTLTLTGTTTPANYQLALRAVQYRHNGDNPSSPKTVSFRADDGDGLGTAGTRNIAITPVNDAPTVTTSGGSATFTEGGSPVVVDSGLTIADPDSTQLSAATVSISANFTAADDTLAVTLQGSITGAYNAGTGVLSLSGAGSLTQYRDVLRSVTYANSSDNPTPTTRTISFQVTDSASAPSNVATRGVTLAGANDAPIVTTTGGSTAYTENAASVAVDAGVTVTDVDDTSLESAQVRISTGFDTGDVLTFTPTGGAGGAGSGYNAGTGVLTLTGPGTVADFQTVLGSVRFSSSNDNPAVSKTIEFKANDGDNDSNLATRTITVTRVNDGPVVTTTVASLAYTENAGPVAVDAGLTLTDPDSAFISSATVTIQAPNFNAAQDSLAFPPNASFTSLYSSATGVLTVTAVGSVTASAFEAALRTVTYTNSSEGPAPLTRTIAVQAFDDAPLAGNTATRGITITPVNDPPTAVDDTGTTDEDTTLNVSAPGVLANDTDLDPGDTKTVVRLNGSLTLTGTSAEGGTVTINANGSYEYTPPAAFQALSTGESDSDSFTYTMQDGGAVQSTATVNLTVDGVSDAPTAVADTFNAIGNTGLFVGTTRPAGDAGKEITGSVLSNDTDPDTPPANLVAEPVTGAATTLGGTITIESDGNFTYQPDDVDTGVTDTFTYRVCDASPCNSGTVANATGTLSLPIAGQVWYVRNNQAAGGDGTSDTPFDTLAEAETASGTGDTTFVFDGDNSTTNLNTGYLMDSGERLIGEVSGLSLDPDGGGPLLTQSLHPGTGGAAPTLTTSAAEDVVSLNASTVLDGFDIDPGSGGGGIGGGTGAGGPAAGNVTIAHVHVNDTATSGTGTQPGLDLDTTTGTNAISDLEVDNGGSATAIGVRLDDAGTVNFASTGTISITTAGAKGLEATGPTTNMGAGSVFDDIAVTGSAMGAVSMSGTTGTTTFGDGSGSDLALTTTSGSAAALLLSNAGTVTVPAGGTANVSATGGPAIDVTGTSGASLSFDDVDSTNSANDGVNLSGLGSGTFSAQAGSTIGGAAGISFDLDGGSGAITFPGDLGNGAGQAAEITNRTGGTVSLSGTVGDTSDAGGGIALSGNGGGGSTTFSGAITVNTTTSAGAGSPLNNAIVMSSSDNYTLNLSGTIDIDSATGKGLEADASGTISVTGSGNTIDSTTGRALNISDTDIASSDVTFQRIASNGASNGIRLNNTANANGSLSVTGNGGSCTSAGTCTGGAIQNSTASGVSLTSVPGGVSLTRSAISASADDGVSGSNVGNGFNLDTAWINGNGNTPITGGVHGDHGVDFTNLTGTSTFTSSNVSNNSDANVVVSDASGTLNLNVSGGTYSGAGGGMGDGIYVEGTGSGSQNLNVQGPITFADNVGDHVQHGGAPTSTADSDVTVNNATMSSPVGGGSVLGGGITVVEGGPTSGGGSNTDVTITNNNIQNSVIGAIAVGTTGSVSDQQIANVDATISGNTIGTAGVAGSGSVQGNGIFVDSNGNSVVRTLIANNTIRQWTNRNGIDLDVIDGDAQMSATVKNNVLTEPNSAFAGTTTRGMTLQLGTAQAGDSVDVCLDIGDAANAALKNQVFGTGEAPQPDVRYLHEGPSSAVQLVGYGGPATPLIADIAGWFQPRNNIGGTPTVTGTPTAPGGSTTTGAASCPLPAP
jgi:VCBS repeat-containing protein